MSKTLSALQKTILTFVFREKFATCTEILTEVWGLQKKGKSKDPSCRSSRVILSKSLNRLWTKDLIEFWYTRYRVGIILTEKGRMIAEHILSD